MAGGSIVGEHSDYERACAVSGYIGIISSGNAKVGVLGDEPMQSTLFFDGNIYNIVRWVYCKSNNSAENALSRMPVENEKIAGDVFIDLSADEFIIFDSVLSFDEINLPKGKYKISTENYKKSGEYSFIIHRLLPWENRDQMHINLQLKCR